MTLIRTFMLVLLLLAGVVVTFAQSEQAGKSPASADATVTVSISAKGVRFTAPGSIGQMRLEVFDAGGGSLYNSDFQPGNVRDWALEDNLGQRLADGSYLCAVTVRDVSGRLRLKQGTVLVQAGQASLKLAEAEQVGAVVPEKALAPVSDGKETVVALMAHDGRDGQVVSTQGGLTFRLGNFFAGHDKELMRLTPDGNLGVGVAQPTARLDVAGAIRTSEGIMFPDGSVQTTAYLASGRSLSERGRLQQRDAQGRAIVAESEPNKLVGLEKALRFAPSISGTGTTGRITKWQDGPNGVVADSVITELSGNVGIGAGTTIPGEKLSVGYGANTDISIGSLTNNKTYLGSFNNNVVFAINRRVSDGNFANPGLPTASFGFYTSSGDSAILFNTSNTNGVLDTERMRIDKSGNVGIGTSSPGAKLDVAGDLQVTGNAVITGNIAAKYQDIAEWVAARQQLAAGTVVILDVTRTDAVVASTRAYDAHIAGVISSQPGLILGQGGQGKVLVAMTGRVKVKVDATRRAIKIGDLLVTGDRSGMAMKSQAIRVAGRLIHRPGTIIGKALEPLAKGQGEILVLLSLQ